MSAKSMLIALCLSLGASAAAKAETYDVVIRGGEVYDGSGGLPYVSDIAVHGDRIALIATKIADCGRIEIDAVQIPSGA